MHIFFCWHNIGCFEWMNTVRLDVEERMAEENLAWNDKNIPAWPKNSSVL